MIQKLFTIELANFPTEMSIQRVVAPLNMFTKYPN
jgi:hypothetical protein